MEEIEAKFLDINVSELKEKLKVFDIQYLKNPQIL